ncbi:hypothetical protein [Halopseudomonas oceani]|nr:hypothetical protein [Halopseudomonas oceani]
MIVSILVGVTRAMAPIVIGTLTAQLTADAYDAFKAKRRSQKPESDTGKD